MDFNFHLLAVAQSDPEISAVLPKHGFPLDHLATCAADKVRQRKPRPRLPFVSEE